jgi:hypothetical protein
MTDKLTCDRCEQPLAKTYWQIDHAHWTNVCGPCHKVWLDRSGVAGSEFETPKEPEQGPSDRGPDEGRGYLDRSHGGNRSHGGEPRADLSEEAMWTMSHLMGQMAIVLSVHRTATTTETQCAACGLADCPGPISRAERFASQLGAALVDDGVYPRLGREIGELVAGKQIQYGRASEKAGSIMALLYPAGIPPHQYRDALLVVRVLDKLSRIAQRGPDRQDLGGESPWQDLAGYGLIGWEADR